MIERVPSPPLNSTSSLTVLSLTVESSSTLSGAVSLGSTLSAVSGASQLAGLTASNVGVGTFSATGYATITGLITGQAGLAVSSATTLTGAVSLGGALSAVSGASSLAGLTSSATTHTSLIVNSATTLTGPVSFGGALSAVSGASILAALTSSATAVTSLTVSSAVTFSGITKVLDQGDFIIQNQADTTKQLEFNLSGQTTGKLVTISSLLTTTQIIQIPNITATDTLATLGLAQAFTAVNTFSNSQDATALGTGALVLSAGGLSVNNQVRIGGVATLSGATVTSSTQTGVLVLNGGTAATSIGMGQGNLNVGGVIQATGAIGSSASINAATTISTTNGSITANNTGGLGTLNLTGTTGGLIVFTNSGEIVSSPAFPLYFIDEVSGDGPWTVFQYAAGTSATGQFNFKGTLSATTSLLGAVVIGNGTAATSVAVGGGNAQIGTALTVGVQASSVGAITVNSSGNAIILANAATGNTARFRYQVNGVTQYDWSAGASAMNLLDTVNSTTPFSYNAGAISACTYVFTGTQDATSASTGAMRLSGGASFTKNTIHAQGLGWGVTSTVSSASPVTLTTASTAIQIFTGTTAQTLNFPAANAFGAGIGYMLIVVNEDSLAVTSTRAGADTFFPGGATTDTVAASTVTRYVSDGVSKWIKW